MSSQTVEIFWTLFKEMLIRASDSVTKGLPHLVPEGRGAGYQPCMSCLYHIDTKG